MNLSAVVICRRPNESCARRCALWPSYPDAAKLGYSLARIQYREDKFSESVATIKLTIGAGRESSEIYNLLGWCLFKQDDAKGAVAALDKAIALDPGD